MHSENEIDFTDSHLHGSKDAVPLESDLCPLAFLFEAAHKQGAQQCSA